MPAQPDLFEQFDAELQALLKRRDFRGAEGLCHSYLRRPGIADDPELAATLAGFLASILTILERPEEALAAEQLAERLTPGDYHRRLNTAARLVLDLRRPDQGLAKLSEALAILPPGKGPRIAWLNLQGLACLALGREVEAIHCFQEIAHPDILTRFPNARSLAAIDLRLVSALVDRGLAVPECRAYLGAAEALGLAKGEADYLAPVRELQMRLRGV